jgi:hypothetical protein
MHKRNPLSRLWRKLRAFFLRQERRERDDPDSSAW